MICQSCGIEAPTRQVAFYQNIGALVMRFHKSIEGRLCKSCIHRYFWQFSLTNLFLGWWGYISLVVTPFFLLNNIGRYTFCLFMPVVPPGAVKPQLTADALLRLNQHTGTIVDKINGGMQLEDVAREVAPLADVTPGQVVLYVYSLIESQKRRQQ
jgi:hypothetical protein